MEEESIPSSVPTSSTPNFASSAQGCGTAAGQIVGERGARRSRRSPGERRFGGAGSPSNAFSPGPMYTYLPSGISLVGLHCVCVWFAITLTLVNAFLGDRFTNGSPYAIRPFSVCLSVCLSCPVLSCPVCPVCIPLVYCGQTVEWIKHSGRPRPWPHCI